MSHSLAYLAGVGAAALGLDIHDVPVKCSDYDAYGDVLNGLRAAPPMVDEEGKTVDEVASDLADMADDIEKASKLLADVLDADEDCDIVALAEMAAARIAAGTAAATAAE